MKLSEFLKTSDAEFFYIGAKSGAAFFAMGNKEEIADEIEYQDSKKQDSILASSSDKIGKLKYYENDRVREYSRRISNITDEIRHLRRMILHVRDKEERQRIRDNIVALNKKLEYNKERLASANEKIKKLYDDIRRQRGKVVKKRVPYAEREVLETYNTIAHKPSGLIVLVDGREQGRYWDYEEFLKGESK